MITDARSLDPTALPNADVIIVGSGPVGIAMALRFEALGVRTVVVEAGGKRYDRTTQNDTFAAEEITSDPPPAGGGVSTEDAWRGIVGMGWQMHSFRPAGF
jgi:flavin-dependent dehydrogenase